MKNLVEDVDLTGKVCLVTGATSGIGLVTAHTLAKMGAELFIVCRNPAKGERTRAYIKEQIGNDRISLLIGDLSSLTEVRKIAQSFLDLDKPLHILLNNAGIINLNRNVTVDGHEEMFAVNHLAHFLLTNLLLDRIKASAPARIVNVSSDAHFLVKGLNFEDLNFKESFKFLKVYGQSKLANILFSRELAKRLEGSGVTANALHPGVIRTGLGLQNGLKVKFLSLLLRPFLISPEKGARTSIYACTSPDVKVLSGLYFENCQQRKPKPWAMDDEAARRLWKVSEEIVGL